MSSAGPTDPAGASARVRLAATAEQVVAAMPGVALTALGNPAWRTVAHDRRIDGVTAIAQADGRYELTLHLAVAWPPEPLPTLADDLRRRVRAAVTGAGLAEELGDLRIDVAAIETDDADGAAA